jgi:hypothetical protein
MFGVADASLGRDELCIVTSEDDLVVVSPPLPACFLPRAVLPLSIRSQLTTFNVPLQHPAARQCRRQLLRTVDLLCFTRISTTLSAYSWKRSDRALPWPLFDAEKERGGLGTAHRHMLQSLRTQKPERSEGATPSHCFDANAGVTAHPASSIGVRKRSKGPRRVGEAL